MAQYPGIHSQPTRGRATQYLIKDEYYFYFNTLVSHKHDSKITVDNIIGRSTPYTRITTKTDYSTL